MNSFKIVASSAIKCPLNKFLDLLNHQNGFFKIQYIKMNPLMAVRVNLPLVKVWKLFLSNGMWQKDDSEVFFYCNHFWIICGCNNFSDGGGERQIFKASKCLHQDHKFMQL